MRVFYLKWAFILTGGKLFYDYLLPFNPGSKVKLWRKSSTLASYGLEQGVHSRMTTAIFIGFFLLGYNYYLIKKYESFDIINLIFYGYPLIVQIYVGLRCYWILQNKRKDEPQVLHEDQ